MYEEKDPECFSLNVCGDYCSDCIFGDLFAVCMDVRADVCSRIYQNCCLNLCLFTALNKRPSSGENLINSKMTLAAEKPARCCCSSNIGALRFVIAIDPGRDGGAGATGIGTSISGNTRHAMRHVFKNVQVSTSVRLLCGRINQDRFR